MLEGTKLRARRVLAAGAVREVSALRGGCLARLPLTTDEISELVRVRYEADELVAIGLLSRKASMAAGLYIGLGLTRHIVREASDALAGSRVQQVVLCGILCATRFKYFEGSGLLPPTCQKCGAQDSFVHLVGCVEMRPPAPSPEPEPMIEFLAELARRATRIHAGVPVPRREESMAVEETEDLELPLTCLSGTRCREERPGSATGAPRDDFSWGSGSGWTETDSKSSKWLRTIAARMRCVF